MKKIAVNTVKNFLAAAKQDNTITRKFPVGDGEFEVAIKTKLTADEKSTFINRVLSGCFDARQNFRPEYITPMIRSTVLQMCTNVPVITVKGDTTEDGAAVMDVGAMDDLYCALDLDRVDDNTYQFMLNEVVQLTHTAIDWKRHRVLADIQAEGSKAVKDVADKLSIVLDTLDTEKLMEYAATLSKNTEGLDASGLVSTILEVDKDTAA